MTEAAHLSEESPGAHDGEPDPQAPHQTAQEADDFASKEGRE